MSLEREDLNLETMIVNGSIDRRRFLQFGAALPLALETLGLRANEALEEPPRRIIFVCNSLGFYRPYLKPKVQGELGTSDYLKTAALKDKMTLFENLFHPGMETSNHDSEKSFLTGALRPEALGFENSVSVDQVLRADLHASGSDTWGPSSA